MQIFHCPFCGARNEIEFHFVAEAGKVRPEPAADVSGEAWAAYLHMTKNPRGPSREIWRHFGCGELFAMERDTLSMTVVAVESLREHGR